MKELKDIIKLKANELGGMAKLAKELNWGSEKNPTSSITKYVNGTMPGFDFAIRWKEVFNENLIDLILESNDSVVAEPKPKYTVYVNKPQENEISTLKTKIQYLLEDIAATRREQIIAMKEKEKCKDELNELKKILPVGD